MQFLNDIMVVYLTDAGCWIHWYKDKDMLMGGKNHFLTPAYGWIHDCIQDLHPVLEPEMVSSL